MIDKPEYKTNMQKTLQTHEIRVLTPEQEARKVSGGARGFFDRVVNFVRGSERLANAVEAQNPVPQTEVQTGGLFERLGRAIDNGVISVRETVSSANINMQRNFLETRNQLGSELAEIDSRRQKLGVVGTLESFGRDLGNGLQSVGERIKARWDEAEADRLSKVREGIESRYISITERRRMKAEGVEFPEDAILSKQALKEALRPVRAAEKAAKQEARQLRQEARRLDRRIEKKQNVVEMLKKVKEDERKRTSQPQSAAATLAGATA